MLFQCALSSFQDYDPHHRNSIKDDKNLTGVKRFFKQVSTLHSLRRAHQLHIRSFDVKWIDELQCIHRTLLDLTDPKM